MASTTVVLPFALPPPELATDLTRVLQAPALAALVARHSLRKLHAFDPADRVLPHESWLARALGSGQGAAPLAAAALRGFGLEQSEGYWFIVHPIHIQLARNHLLMADPRQLRLDEADSRALFDAARPYFEEVGKTLLYGDAETWFMRADEWSVLRTASPDAAAGVNLSDWMPEGPNTLAFRKLQNEIQMLWHEHPVNQAREARRLPPVNSFWMWGGAAAPAPQAPLKLASCECPAWLAALAPAGARAASAANVLAAPDSVTVLGQLIAPGLGGDWSAWLLEMQRLEQEWFAPLLAGVKDGRIGNLTLILGRRDSWLEIRTNKLAQHKFWCAPKLKNLHT
ncbi:hypothetical protein [Pseudoduganella violacea]|uniref:Phosphoglycerate mutase n=1 Tax=Pseudoduganella violacea TaxID=1715466 RepID=A0A7W5FUU8_9BURK|nr:hypothetical protein [Pseudoduganella violacea]MBB3120112.1 hypothetical protein [Pseudoduganella violacea]